ncbi:thioester domain-containing protein [Kitasatospora sp. GP82]|uniref:thioester domain-containing protein n=1 Tax=Kitasatospora sp. GP82 TaxID=3035089 RepID=UPI0024742459|nr:thioester domain-containing protein [Kitasatospora sp. GP82]
MLATSVAVGGGMITAGAAVAAGSNISGTTAVLAPGLKNGEAIRIIGDKEMGLVEGGIIQLKTSEGQTLDTYCIDLHNPTKEGTTYQETAWDSAPVLKGKTEAVGKVRWILQHSFPKVSVDQLAKDAGIPGLSADDAAAGTQAAIWHFSDGANAVPEQAKAKVLTTYLEGHAVPLAEPSPTLSLSPSTVSGKSGSQLGPIKVTTNGASVDLAVDGTDSKAGLTITDQNGKQVKSAKSGDTIFAKTAAGAPAGTATIKASTTAEVSVGRAFTGMGAEGKHSQTLILAGSQPVTVTASASLSWTPAGSTTSSPTPTPTPTAGVGTGGTTGGSTGGGLAFTGGGSETPWLAGIAGALLVAGGGAVFALRRRGRHGRTAA